ncbi:hypothetical protein GCM10022409_26200 [Hymenobacter glaciei]|uniref:Outer membrane protein beta-barrel domain-containing protein n=1 Tax=Hymenobacter glaciei TaxID=877209 RepID=A0ABP7UB61_9BACT
MWSDNDIDNAFRRLDPAEPDPTPFPLDAWLKLETGLDQAVIDRAVRRRLWQFFAAEVAAVALVGLGWSLWPSAAPASVGSKTQTMVSSARAVEKTGHAKHLQGLGASVASAPIIRQPAAVPANVTPAMPGRVAMPSAITPATTPATGAVARVSATREAVAYRRRLPLAVAVTPNARFHSAPGREAAERGGTAFGRSVTTPTHQAAGRTTEAASRTRMAVAVETATSANTGTQPETRLGTEAPSNVAGSRMGALSQATGSRHKAALTIPTASPSKTNTRIAATGLTGSSETGTAATPQAADAPLASVATTAVALVQPLAAPLPALVAPVELTPNPLPTAVHKPRFSVGVVAAPDVSTVKFADVQAPHLNVGLTLEYQLGQRWRVTTGVQRSTKSYYARREDYDWSVYPKALTRDFTTVDGNCTVVDVPLNLRYDALVTPRYRVFGTVGLSSFFMQRERYSYDYYDYASSTDVLWERSYSNANQHWFSVLNLSAGYEYGLGTHWRLQAEPYVKVPLAGVGVGKVQLLSAGVYVGVKYGF